MSKIEECLMQLNDLLIAAGQCQPGQVARKVNTAREELKHLDAKGYVNLGDCDKGGFAMSYRLSRHGILVYKASYATWMPTGNLDHPQFREWVAGKLSEISGVSLSSDTALICKLQEANAKHQKLRDNLFAVLNTD